MVQPHVRQKGQHSEKDVIKLPWHVGDLSARVADVQELADSPADSELRFRSRALLPGYAKRLREVGPAVSTLISADGLLDTSQISSRYGGEAEGATPADELLKCIGATITISGRCALSFTGQSWVNQSLLASDACFHWHQESSPTLVRREALLGIVYDSIAEQSR